jgi:FkbM family methyltransferase
MIRKLSIYLKRASNSRRYGVAFRRARSFTMPSSVRIGPASVALSYPGEGGVLADFVTCFLDDEYGLAASDGPCSAILDIGANVGFFTMAARSWFPNATIHAYEPNRRTLPYLRANTERCGVTVYPEAVGSKSGFITVVDDGDSNLARTERAAPDGEGSVALTALSVAVERLGGTVDFAKIDCEGGEWDLFQDPAPWQKIRHVRMEYHLWNRHDYSEVESSLRRLGYVIRLNRPQGEWGTVWAARA